MKKFLGYLLVTVISIVVALFLSGALDTEPAPDYSYDFSDTGDTDLPSDSDDDLDLDLDLPSYPDDDTSSDSDTDTPSVPDNNASAESRVDLPFGTSYYSQLSAFQKKIYAAMVGPISEGEKEFVIDNVHVEDFERDCFEVTTAIQYDHPEYFWYTGGYSFRSSRPANSMIGKITMKPIYYEYATAFFNNERKQQELMTAVKNVADLARMHSKDTYEQAVYVHDYLTENAYYDHDGLDEYYRTNHNPSCEYIFSAYGCLVNRRTVCSGYAKAYMLIMRELGVDCIYITGDAGEAHGWNCIFLDGEGYYVDITWDDPDLESNEPLYDYAFITGKMLAKTHKVDMMFDAPNCTATKFNYFLKRGYYAETYQFDTVAAILSQQAKGDAVHIRFGSAAELEKACTELLKNGKFSKIKDISTFERYIKNDKMYTLTFFRN